MGKRSVLTPECKLILREEANLIKLSSKKEAKNFYKAFRKARTSIETLPGMGTREGTMRKTLLGKFRYWIFYEEMDQYISILGIYHTSRDGSFNPDNPLA
jgi:plasmid stabilization system protein ParE